MVTRGFFKGLQGKVLAVFLLLSLVPLLLVSAISYRSSQNGLKSMAREMMTHSAEGLMRTVDAQINEAQDDVKAWAGLGVVAGALEKKEYPQLSAILAGLHQEYEAYKAIMVFDAAGNLVASSDASLLRDGSVPRNHAGSGWFQAALKGAVQIDDVQYSELLKDKVVTFSAPVRDAHGKVIGVIGSWMLWSEVERLVDEAKSGETGYAFVINKQGTIIAHPKRDKVLKESLLKDQKSAELSAIGRRMVKGERGQGEYSYEGSEKMVAYAPSKGRGDYKGLGWSYGFVRASDDILAPARLLRNVMAGLVILCALVICALAVFIARAMARPLIEAVAFAQAVAAGDLTGRLEVRNNDEIGDLGRALNAMAVGLKEMVGKILASSGEVAAAAVQISANTAQLTKAAQGQAAAAEETSATMVQMAASIETVATNADSLASSADEVSSSVEGLGASSEQVAKSAEVMAGSVSETSATIEQMAGSIENVAKNAEDLVSSVTETSVTIEEMTLAIDQVAVKTQELQRVVKESSATIEEMAESLSKVAGKVEEADAVAKGAANEGAAGLKASGDSVAAMARVAEVIDRTSASILNLGKRSEEIGQIVDVINGIADQTNLLALNAAIEAARAGDAGRGFAVVADEVRKLAERSMGATREIAEVIRQVQQDTEESVKFGEIASREAQSSMALSAAAGGSLTKIVTSIERTSTLMSDISRMTAEQAKASGQVIQAVEQMSRASDVVADAAREQAAGGRQIRLTVERMNHITREVTGATRDQALGSRQIRSAVENMNRVTGEVTVATREQSLSARQIVSAVNDMNAMTRTVALATSEQKKGGEMVVVAMDNISGVSRENLSAVEQLLKASQGLSAQAGELAQVVAWFQVA